jgi:3',5'-cyclic AMP phosphodiesterase CpdA
MTDLLKIFEKDEPRFMIYAGDAPHRGGVAPQWDRWFQALEPFASQRPVMLSVGNHELGGDPQLINFRLYNALPASPGQETYYSFDYGPVHFMCLDTDSKLSPGQVSWIGKDLAANKKPWKVVFLHRPLFSSGIPHGSDPKLQQFFGPIFSRHHVNLVISGHDHLYERSKPINWLKSENSPVGSYREGTCYVVSAGAGAGLYQARSGNWWTAVLKTQTHHFCRIKVQGAKSMILEAVALNGQVLDAVTLEP